MSVVAQTLISITGNSRFFEFAFVRFNESGIIDSLFGLFTKWELIRNLPVISILSLQWLGPKLLRLGAWQAPGSIFAVLSCHVVIATSSGSSFLLVPKSSHLALSYLLLIISLIGSHVHSRISNHGHVIGHDWVLHQGQLAPSFLILLLLLSLFKVDQFILQVGQIYISVVKSDLFLWHLDQLLSCVPLNVSQ